jgi:CRISPR-associated endoribonuclease Cas6
MRAKIHVKKVNKLPVQFDYQYYLAAVMYRKLACVDFIKADETHRKEGYKFFTYSNLILEDKKECNKGFNKGLEFQNAHIVVTSPNKEFIRCFAQGFLQEPEFNLGRARLVAEKVELLKEEKIGTKVELKTISPIYSKTIRETPNGLVEWDLYPKDGKFHENIHKNLLEKYKEYYGKIPEDNFEIISLIDFKPKRVCIDNSYRRCSLMRFTAAGSNELLQFAYDAGLGEKNAMGFGCVEVIK